MEDNAKQSTGMITKVDVTSCFSVGICVHPPSEWLVIFMHKF